MWKLVLLTAVLGFHCHFDQPTAFEVVCSKFNSEFDYAILGGMVIDGTGSPGRMADLLIKGDSIVFVGHVEPGRIKARIINAESRLVTPGFIDVHAHGDPLSDDFSNFLRMGVTTIILGQDGRSPVSAFGDPAGYFDTLQSRTSLVNLAFLSGHGDLRQSFGNRKFLSPEEIDSLVIRLRDDLKAGCFGMSTGLEYYPGYLAQRQELVALAKEVNTHAGFIMSHLRSEDDSQLDSAISELIDQGRECPVHVSHLKVVYGKHPERASGILDLFNEARNNDISISADVYPYAASYTGISIVFPEWAKIPKDFELALESRRDELRRFLRTKIMERNGPEATLFATRPFTGKTLAEVAAESGQDFVDILLKIGPAGASGAYFVMNEEIQEKFILHPEIMISSDGGPNLRHPRSYGAFAKIIEKYVVETQKLTIENAIHKMSGLSAATLNIPGRGLLKPGYKADILVFDASKIKANSSYENPFIHATGFEHIFVNGHLTINQSNLSRSGKGMVLQPVK